VRFLLKGNWRTKLYLTGTDLLWGNRHLTSPGETYNFCLGEAQALYRNSAVHFPSYRQPRKTGAEASSCCSPFSSAPFEVTDGEQFQFHI